MKTLSYSTFMTLSEGEYQISSHSYKSFGLYINSLKQVSLLFVSDTPMMNLHNDKKITLNNDGDICSLSISDVDVSINDIFIRHNMSSLEDILEEKETINTIHTIDISNFNYDILNSLTKNEEILPLYFYHVNDIDKFKETFNNELNSLLSETEVENEYDADMIFETSNLSYFDIFPIFKQFKENPANMDIINGTNLIKMKVKVKK